MNRAPNPLDTNILLESGTNEVEVLVFQVGQLTLGINVAKVREVLTMPCMTQLPSSHPSMYGCFRLREVVVPCLSLHKHLNEQPTSSSEESVVILTEFNQYQIGFVVDKVERIHRLSWNLVMPVPPVISQGQAPVTAITRIDNRLITMLDFETIASEVALPTENHAVVENKLDVARGAQLVAIADDSPTARKSVEAVLRDSGYTSVFAFENGAELWNWLLQKCHHECGERVPVDLVITDIEMPVTDGFHLTRNIKEHPQLRHIPVLLYSSILTPDNLKKGQQVRADAQITKPELHRVVSMADELIHRSSHHPTSEHAVSA